MKEYLGDGVYADIDRDMLRLTAENGICATDTIYLEPEVCYALLSYMQRHTNLALVEKLSELERSE